jgi:hypothetical protein
LSTKKIKETPRKQRNNHERFSSLGKRVNALYMYLIIMIKNSVKQIGLRVFERRFLLGIQEVTRTIYPSPTGLFLKNPK